MSAEFDGGSKPPPYAISVNIKFSEKFRSIYEGYVPQCGKMSRSDKRDGLPSGAVKRFAFD